MTNDPLCVLQPPPPHCSQGRGVTGGAHGDNGSFRPGVIWADFGICTSFLLVSADLREAQFLQASSLVVVITSTSRLNRSALEEKLVESTGHKKAIFLFRCLFEGRWPLIEIPLFKKTHSSMGPRLIWILLIGERLPRPSPAVRSPSVRLGGPFQISTTLPANNKGVLEVFSKITPPIGAENCPEGR